MKTTTAQHIGMLHNVSNASRLHSIPSTYTAPSTIGNVCVFVESVGFWQTAELSPALHVLEDESRSINVLVIFLTTAVPY